MSEIKTTENDAERNDELITMYGIWNVLTVLTLIVTVYDVINDNITPLMIVNVFLLALDIYMIIHTSKELKRRFG